MNWGPIALDPDSARADAEVLKTIVRERDNRVGVYGATTQRGRIAVGQPVFFERAYIRTCAPSSMT